MLLNILGDKVKCSGYYIIQGVSVISDLSTAGIVVTLSHVMPASMGNSDFPISLQLNLPNFTERSRSADFLLLRRPLTL